MYRKYSSEEKLNIVEGYRNGIFSLEERAHELGYKTAPGCFKRWLRQYQEQGAEELLHLTGNNSYTAEFKTMVVGVYHCGKGNMEKYQPKPVRRTYIPKKNGKMRPLGIPTFTDKLVQEAVF